MKNQRKYKVAMMLQDFCFGDNYKNILSPEIQNIFILRNIKKSSDCGHLYDIDFVLSDGTVIADDLTTIKGFCCNYNYNYDFIIYVHQQPSFDIFRVCLNWVPQEYLLHHSFWQINNDPLQAASIIKMIEHYNYHEKNVILSDFHNRLLVENSFDCTYLSFNPFCDLIAPIKNYENATIFYSCATLPLERHGALIKELDNRDYCKFYGHASNWRQIRNYQKQIDYGEAIYDTINQNGIVLAIHSKVHCAYEFYTNRIAEACIAGAIIIADNFSNLKDLFCDSIFTIDTDMSAKEVANQIDGIVQWVRSNPYEAREKALQSQEIFARNFMKKDWIYKICQTIDNAKHAYISQLAEIGDNRIVDVIYHNMNCIDRVELSKILDQLLKQYHKNFNFIICCDSKYEGVIRNDIVSILQNNNNVTFDIVINNDANLLSNNSGHSFLSAKEKFKGSYFTFIHSHSLWNMDHISRLIGEIEQDQEVNYLCAYSGIAFIHDNKIRGLDYNTKNTIVFPILVKSLMEFYNPAHVSKESPFFNTFENEVEIRFPIGSQIFRREVVDLIDDHVKRGFFVLNNCEHIALLVLLMINEKMKTVLFSPYISYILDIDSPDPCHTYAESVKYSLYPNARCGEYLQSYNCIAAQLSKIFFDHAKFRSIYSLFGIHNNCHSVSEAAEQNLSRSLRVSKKHKYLHKIATLTNKHHVNYFIKLPYYLLKFYCTMQRTLLSPKRKIDRLRNKMSRQGRQMNILISESLNFGPMWRHVISFISTLASNKNNKKIAHQDGQINILISGPLNFGPIGRHAISFISTLASNKNNHILIDGYWFDHFGPNEAEKNQLKDFFVAKSVTIVEDHNKQNYDFLIYTGVLSHCRSDNQIGRIVALKAKIKICYPVFDGTVPPLDWIDIINDKFDIALTPSHYVASHLVKYGVKKPCFGLHCAILNEELLARKPSNHIQKIRFGFIGAAEQRKNPLKLVEAFHKNFAGNDDVELFIHCSYSFELEYQKQLAELISKYQADSNIIFSYGKNKTHEEMVELFASFHCYIYPQKTSGYFTTAAEALSLGIPIIISDIGVHQELVQDAELTEQDGVFLIKHEIAEPICHHSLDKRYLGVQYNCTVDDISDAMSRFYESRSWLFTEELVIKRKMAGSRYSATSLAKDYNSVIDGSYINKHSTSTQLIFLTKDARVAELIEYFSLITQRQYQLL